MEHPATHIHTDPLMKSLGGGLMEEWGNIYDLMDAKVDHPYHQLAGHLLDLHLAAARVACDSTPDTLVLTGGVATMAHLCAAHVDAAILLILAGRKVGPEGAVEIAHKGLTSVRYLLQQ